MKYIVATLLFSITYIAAAQISNVADVRGVPLRQEVYQYVEGNPYYDEGEWEIGNIIDVDGKVHKNMRLRFNAYDNELEYFEEMPYIADKDIVAAFTISFTDQLGVTETYKFARGFTVPGKVKDSDYVHVIYQGEEIQLVHKVFKQKVTITPASYGESDYDKFVDSDDYYLITKSGVEDFKISKKSFYNSFPEMKDEIKKFMKETKTNLNDASDLERLFKFIESGNIG